MEKFIHKNKLYLLGIMAGGVFGFFYWKFVGCNNGTCMISSKPLNSILYFSVVGALVFSIAKKD